MSVFPTRRHAIMSGLKSAQVPRGQRGILQQAQPAGEVFSLEETIREAGVGQGGWPSRAGPENVLGPFSCRFPVGRWLRSLCVLAFNPDLRLQPDSESKGAGAAQNMPFLGMWFTGISQTSTFVQSNRSIRKASKTQMPRPWPRPTMVQGPGVYTLFLFGYACGIQKFSGQGSSPGHSSDLRHSCDNARSLTPRAPGNFLEFLSINIFNGHSHFWARD